MVLYIFIFTILVTVAVTLCLIVKRRNIHETFAATAIPSGKIEYFEICANILHRTIFGEHFYIHII